MTSGISLPAKGWMHTFACILLATTLQGCIGGGGGGSSGGAPAPTVSEAQPQQLGEPTAESPVIELGESSKSSDSTTNIKAPTPVNTGTPGAIVTPIVPPSQDSNLGTGMLSLIGINIAGAEFTSGTLPGQNGTHYFFPKQSHFDQWSLRGVRTVRFPIKWERLQPSLNGALDPVYAGLIDTMLTQAARAEMDIILDVHNYGRYRGNIIGSSEVPFAAYQNLLARMAQRWVGYSALYAYDIMNEPYGAADATWPTAAQHGIDGVRQHDRRRPIYIEGMSYSSAARWPQTADKLLGLKDPINNLVFSAHLYLDSDASGTYTDAAGSAVDPMVGVKRAQPFINWLAKHGKRGQIGEVGIPNESRYMQAMENLLVYLQQNCIPITYWAAGPSWGNYKLSIEPNKDGSDKAQWKLLEKFVGRGNCSDYGPLR